MFNLATHNGIALHDGAVEACDEDEWHRHVG
jgi:hypothetical protein